MRHENNFSVHVIEYIIIFSNDVGEASDVVNFP